MQQQSAIRGKKGSVAVLDIGTGKVACFIAEPNAEGELHITGIGHQLARGMKSGMIIDASELETSILSAVHTAEQMAQETIENVVVSLSGPHMVSHQVSVELAVAGEGVSERDIADILREGCATVHEEQRSVIHCFVTHYHLDDAYGIRDPRHMYGSRLGSDLHIVTADNARLKNLSGCIARCHLNVAEFVMASHASGQGCLEPDEVDMGVVLIDIGGGETSFSVFRGGSNLYSDVVPIGGNHITSDIAQGLSTSIANAERLKTLHASAIAASQDNQIMVEIPQLGEDDEPDEDNMVPRAMLGGIVRPRLEEIFEMVRHKLETCGVEVQSIRGVVLTGGGSQMLGLREFVGRTLGKQVRLGKPRLLPGLADSVSGPAFSTTVGMLRYVAHRPLEDRLFEAPRHRKGVAARLEKLAAWFKENF